ncbi:hypothetical protein GOQ30_14570 [Flavobacterium sp. TP390]|uniref:Uncharacterized protein n=1 Tax=Flavobacterium profundi TaxID=1774945 RepID=A0A6I4IUA5_9FLAO|nr:hypothetical protein [Flavobacterium profundi]MVO10395.1 hypothetical protein [Flavobacterium profundi]
MSVLTKKEQKNVVILGGGDELITNPPKLRKPLPFGIEGSQFMCTMYYGVGWTYVGYGTCIHHN